MPRGSKKIRGGCLCRYSEGEIAFAKQAGFGSTQVLLSPGDPLDPRARRRPGNLSAFARVCLTT